MRRLPFLFLLVGFLPAACGNPPAADESDGEESGSEDTDSDSNSGSESETDDTGIIDDFPNESCGDGILDDGERCDDGNDTDLDGCNTDCRVTASLRWEHFFSGDGEESGARDAAFDADGNLYVVGWLDTGPGLNDDDIYVVKYASDGSELWSKAFDGSTLSYSERGDAVAAAPDGGVFVLGNDFDAANNDGNNVRILYLDDDGETVWDTVYVGPAGFADRGRDLVVGPDDAIYVVGSQEVAADDRDAWIGIFDLDGDLIDETVLDYVDGESASFSSVALTKDGDPVVSGSTPVVPGGDGDAWLTRFDSSYAVVWEQFVAGSAAQSDSFGQLAATPEGEMVVIGSVRGDNSTDILIARYDADGNNLWTIQRDGMMHFIDLVNGLDVDLDGSIVVGGAERNDPDDQTVLTRFIEKLDGDGETIWRMDGEIDESLSISGIAIGPQGCIAAVGTQNAGSNVYNGWVRVLER